jgi:hypothetical protein
MEWDGNAAVGHLVNSQVRKRRMLGSQVADLCNSFLSECCNGLCILFR